MAKWEAKGYWTRDTIHWPRPVHPLFVSFGLKPIEIGSEKAYEEWCIPSIKNAYLVLNGYVYQRAELIGGEAPPIMEKFPFLFNLWRLDPNMKKRILGFDRFMKEKGFEKNIGTFKKEWEPEAKTRLKPILEFDPSKATNEELAKHLEECYDFLCCSWNPHVKIVMIGMYIRDKWVGVCQRLLNLTEFEGYELVQVGDEEVTVVTRRLLELARGAEKDPQIKEIFSLPHEEAYEKLAGTWFRKELDQFLDEEGDRPVDSFELDPTWREMPEIVLGIIKGFMGTDYDPLSEEEEFQSYRRERIAELRKSLKGDSLKEFDYWLELAEKAQPLTETHDYILSNIPLCHVRYGALEAGRRFVEKKALTSPEDTLFLYREELLSALRGELPLNEVKALVQERKEERKYQFTLTPPSTLGKAPADPPWNVFPPRAAEGMKILVNQASSIEVHENATGLTPEGELFGTPGSPGVAEGTVRIIHTVEEFQEVQKGDVLVCPFTTPTWTVLFPQVAALVTDTGGSLSHAAIVA
ncbi:MAG: phosphoenolpyruvate-utilizing protein, partial [Desulfitobacterium sp.]|nr:phosphoenolpyruvate-utilizing protein [Desulfitobacterium sp.]